MPGVLAQVSIIYSAATISRVYGAWDALIALAREVQRLFHRFTEENLKAVTRGPRARPFRWPLRWRRKPTPPLAAVYEEAGRNLDLA